MGYIRPQAYTNEKPLESAPDDAMVIAQLNTPDPSLQSPHSLQILHAMPRRHSVCLVDANMPKPRQRSKHGLIDESVADGTPFKLLMISPSSLDWKGLVNQVVLPTGRMMRPLDNPAKAVRVP